MCIISSCVRNQVSIKIHRRNLLNQRLPFSRPAVSRWWFASFPRCTNTEGDGSPRRDLYSERDVALGRSITVGPWHHEEIAWDLSRALIPQPRNMFEIGRSIARINRTDEWLIEMSRRHDCADVDLLWFTTVRSVDD